MPAWSSWPAWLASSCHLGLLSPSASSSLLLPLCSVFPSSACVAAACLLLGVLRALVSRYCAIGYGQDAPVKPRASDPTRKAAIDGRRGWVLRVVAQQTDVPDLVFMVVIYRIGEAHNPGPYQYGGATSSSSAHASASTAIPPQLAAVGNLGASVKDQGRLSDFDDAEGWNFMNEEEHNVSTSVAFLEPPSSDQESGVADSTGPVQRDRPGFDKLSKEIGIANEEAELGRQSAMVEWEACPALVEGVVELPVVDEEEDGFRTVEGWWVSDPLARQHRQQAAQREARLGIRGLKGRVSNLRGGCAWPPAVPCPKPKYGVYEKLAQFSSEALPLEPQVEECLPSPCADASPEVAVARTADSSMGVQAERSTRRRKRGSKRRSGPRGPQHDGDETVSIWSFNTSGAPQLRAAVNHCRKDGGDVPVAILCQEHHAGAEQLADLQAQIRAAGWKLAAARAECTPAGGRSAGVGICTPSWVAAGLDSNMHVDCSPPSSLGRVAALWIQQVVPGGILLVSCYLYDGEGCSIKNLEVLSQALRVAKASGCPWLVGLDAQQEPGELLKWAAPIVDRAGGAIVAPAEPTHFPGVGCGRCLDYFIADRSIAEAVHSVSTVAELRCVSRDSDYIVAARPHRAVKLRLRKKFNPLLLKTLKMPRAFPRNKPIGCARHPVALVADFAAGIVLDVGRDQKVEAVSALWSRVVDDIEAELCGVCDFEGSVHCGRKLGVSEVLRPVVPRRAAGSKGAMVQSEFATVWGMNRLRELLVLSELHQKHGTHSPGQARQWDGLLRKVCSPSAPIASAGEDRWSLISDTLQRYWSSPGDAAEALRTTHNWAEALTKRQSRVRAEKHRESWDKWKKKQHAFGGHGGALFQFLKRVEEDPEIVTRCSGARTASPQAILSQDFTVWNNLWQKLSHVAETPWRFEEEGSPAPYALPALSHVELRKAARTFKVSTAAGADALLPSHFAWLSDELLDSIGELLQVVETAGCWPSQLALSVIHLIPKQVGGKRPIGLLASLIRLWDRSRKPVVDHWRESCVRDYDWMRKGRGAERSVWAQSIYEEAAGAEGKSSASVFIDLVKAFEQVVLGQVWRSGLKHRMPRRILRLALESCAFSRRLTYKGAVSEVADTYTAILAGSGRATDLLFVTLIDAVDGILRRHEYADTRTVLRCFMVVDDIRLAVEGEEGEVAAYLPAIADDAVQVLEGQLNMQVSRDGLGVVGKTVAQASSKRLGVRIGSRLRILGVRVKEKVKNLGVQFAARSVRGRVNNEAVKRYKLGLRRVQRAVRVGRKAQQQALRTLLVPSFTFGSSAVSCPVALVRQLRTQMAKSFGPIEGRSTTARLLLEEADVSLTVAIKTVMSWVCGAWDGLIEDAVLQRAWKQACISNITAGKRRGALTGAAAYVTALHQLGWSAPSVHSVRTRMGHILYFGSETVPSGAYSADPSFIKIVAKEDYECIALASSTLAKDLADLSGLRGYPKDDRHAQAALRDIEAAGGDDLLPGTRVEAETRAAAVWRRGRFEHSIDGPLPWLWPIRAVMQAARRLGLHKEAASTRALADGGWPTQFRLRCHGHAEHILCACRQAVGTLRHKLGNCSLSKELRDSECPEWLRSCCQRDAWDPLFTRGVPARPKAPKVPSDIEWLEAEVPGPVCAATGDVYTDGSAKGLWWIARRGGWAVVALDSAGRWKWTRRGTLGGLNITSFRAELRALLEALKVAEPLVRIHTDNQAVVDGVSSGKVWCTRAKAVGADLWRCIWDKLDALRTEGAVTVMKVKAHTGWRELLSRQISPRDQFGNWLADAAAKTASRHSELEAPTAAVNAQVAKALAWIRWAARYSADWVTDTEPSESNVVVSAVYADREWEYGDAHLRHETWSFGKRALCRRCGLNLPGPEDHEKRVSWQCSGAAAGRAAARATGNINFIWSRFAFSRRELIERGGRLITAIPPPRWLVDFKNLEDAAEDQAHLREMRLYVASRDSERIGGGTLAVPAWLRAPDWMPQHLLQPWGKEDAAWGRLYGCVREVLGDRDSEHRIAFAGPMAFCSRCACFAERRLGSRFKGDCVLPTGRAASAVAYRLARLRECRHPITGEAMRAGCDL